MFCNITTVFNFHLDSSSHVEIYIFAISHHQPDFSEVTRLFSVSILEKKKKKKDTSIVLLKSKVGNLLTANQTTRTAQIRRTSSGRRGGQNVDAYIPLSFIKSLYLKPAGAV